MSEPRRLKRAIIKEEFVDLTGDLVSAIFLNQLLYWTERVKDVDAYIVEEKARGKGADIDLTHGWIYKKADELISETMVTVSPSTARRRLEDLESLGIIECRTNPNNGWDKVLQYRVKLVELSAALYAKGFALEGYSLPAFDANSRGNTPVNHHDVPSRQIDDSRNQIDDSERRGDAAIPDITTDTTSRNGGDQRVQDLPITTVAAPPPSPKAMIVNQVLGILSPVKANAVTENSPGLIRAEAGGAAGHRNLSGQQGIVGLVQAAADKFNGTGHRNRIQCHIDGLKSKLERRNIDMPMLVMMTDKVLDEMGRTALANGESEAADTALREAQQFISDLTDTGRRFWTIDGIVSVFRSWETHDKRPRPSYKQLLEHASLMVAGKLEKKPAAGSAGRYDFSNPDRPDKRWLLDTYQQDNLDYIVQVAPRDKQAIAKANILKKWSELCKQ